MWRWKKLVDECLGWKFSATEDKVHFVSQQDSAIIPEQTARCSNYSLSAPHCLLGPFQTHTLEKNKEKNTVLPFKTLLFGRAEWIWSDGPILSRHSGKLAALHYTFFKTTAESNTQLHQDLPRPSVLINLINFPLNLLLVSHPILFTVRLINPYSDTVRIKGSKHFLWPHPLVMEDDQKPLGSSKLILKKMYYMWWRYARLRCRLTSCLQARPKQACLLTSGHAAKCLCQVWYQYTKAVLRNGFTSCLVILLYFMDKIW